MTKIFANQRVRIIEHPENNGAIYDYINVEQIAGNVCHVTYGHEDEYPEDTVQRTFYAEIDDAGMAELKEMDYERLYDAVKAIEENGIFEI